MSCLSLSSLSQSLDTNKSVKKEMRTETKTQKARHSIIPHWVMFHAFLSSADFILFFFKIKCFEEKKSFSNTVRLSNSLDPDQAPDLGPNCLPRLLADDTGKQRVKITIKDAPSAFIQVCHICIWESVVHSVLIPSMFYICCLFSSF